MSDTGRATYDAAREIRSGDITRGEGMALVNKFDGGFSERFAEETFRYLSLSEKEFPCVSNDFAQPQMDCAYFDKLTDSFRSPHQRKRDGDHWVQRHLVTDPEN